MRSRRWIRNASSILVVVSTLFVGRALAYIYVQVGVDSNFLVDGGRVCFAQSDGSLTMLLLDTGEVILRRKDRDYSGTIVGTDDGILVLGYEKITMLERATLLPIWETSLYYEANVINNLLVSYDGWGLVECRYLSDGSTRWSYNLPGALDITAEGQYVLVHRAATYEGTPTTVLLDLDTGKEVFTKQPLPHTHYEKVFFDGTNIYLETGRFVNKRSDFVSEKMTVWNTSGEEVASLSLSGVERQYGTLADDPFVIDDKTFYMGRVYSQDQPVPPRRPGRGKVVRPDSSDDDNHFTDTVVRKFPVDEGEVLIEYPRYDSPSLGRMSARFQAIELKSKAGNWKGVLSYLKGEGRVSVVGASERKLLIGTNLGHVECVEKGTGSSLWMYIFPTMRHTASFSSPHGMPPTMAEAAAIYRRENRRIAPVSGMRLIDSAEPAAHPRIVFDPDPTDPFEKLPLYLAIAWSGAILPLILLSCILISPRIRRLDPRALALVSVVLTFVSISCFLSYGWVSLISSIAIRLSIIVAAIIGLTYCIEAYRKKKFVAATLLVLALAALLGFIYPALWALVA